MNLPPLKYIEIPSVGPCVYFLFDGDEVVYVGESFDSLAERVYCHRRSGKAFDRIGYIDAPAKAVERLALERHWMETLRPKYNGEIHTRPKAPSHPAWRLADMEEPLKALSERDVPDAPIVDRPLTALRFHRRKTAALLVNAGCTTVADVVSREPNALLMQRGCGVFALNDIRQALNTHGLALAGDNLHEVYTVV